MVRLGDFTVPAAALESATEQYGERSDEARAADKRRRAPVTTDAQKYARRPGELDFPGVDTPREAPPLLPKDQMRKGAELSLSGRASGRLPADVMGLSRDAEVRDQELAERGVPASKDEVDFGTGAVGMTAIGGFDEVSGGEKDPLYAGTGPLSDREMNDVTRDEQRIGELALENDPYDGQPMPFSSGSDKQLFELSPWTVSKSRTALNKKVYVEEREELDPLREKFTGLTGDSLRPVVLDDEERQEVVGALREDYDMWDGLVQEGRKETLMSRDTTEDRDLVGGALEELGEDIGAGVDDTLSRMDNATRGL